jgi:hypothetical protein
MKSKKEIKGYKAYNNDMTCRGIKFEEGKEYKTDRALICNEGYHFCENPLDVLNYYDLCDSKFSEVMSLPNSDIDKSNDDSKRCTTNIKIGAKLNLPAFIKASFEFIYNSVKNKKDGDSSKVATSGDYSKVATSGDCSQVATSGKYSKVATSGVYSKVATSGNSSKVATSGYYSKVATSGDSSKVATSGYYSKVATSGDSSKVATSGDYSKVVTSGDSSKVATSGDYSKVVTSGDSSKVATSGKYSQVATSGDSSKVALNGIDSVGMCSAPDSIIKGKIGNWITLSEWIYDNDKERYIPKCVKSAQIDGKKIKEDIYYKLSKGKFVQVK